MLRIIAGVFFVLSHLTATVLLFIGLVALLVSLFREDYHLFERSLMAFALAMLFAFMARLLRRFEL